MLFQSSIHLYWGLRVSLFNGYIQYIVLIVYTVKSASFLWSADWWIIDWPCYRFCRGRWSCTNLRYQFHTLHIFITLCMKNFYVVQLLQFLVVSKGSYTISVLCIMHVSGSWLVNGLCGSVIMKPWNSVPFASYCLQNLMHSVHPGLRNLSCSNSVLCNVINKSWLSLESELHTLS